MGNSSSNLNKLNYEDLNLLIKRNDSIIINTMPVKLQGCLIVNTLNIAEEENTINLYLTKNKGINIVIYGKNCSDDTIYKKYNQLVELGFNNIHLYPGGMFEWLLLQDIYGKDEFVTTSNELDILKYKPESKLTKLYITNG